jgi:membrane peptidoglycan carboxypeptidase
LILAPAAAEPFTRSADACEAVVSATHSWSGRRVAGHGGASAHPPRRDNRQDDQWRASHPAQESAVPPNQQSSYVYANDGKTLITTFYNQNRRDVGLSDIAAVMQQALVAAEDRRFHQHSGVDIKGTLRALVSHARNGDAGQGGSTLTMQYVRNVLKNDPTLTPQQRQAATASTPIRKLKEMRYAMALEKRLPKPEILDRYLNIAYFGNGAYGVDAASHSYFSKPPSELTPVAEASPHPEEDVMPGISRVGARVRPAGRTG